MPFLRCPMPLTHLALFIQKQWLEEKEEGGMWGQQQVTVPLTLGVSQHDRFSGPPGSERWKTPLQDLWTFCPSSRNRCYFKREEGSFRLTEAQSRRWSPPASPAAALRGSLSVTPIVVECGMLSLSVCLSTSSHLLLRVAL